MINRLCIIGVGLIGGSLARALRRANACKHITGCGRSDEHLQRALELGVIDEYTTDIAHAVKGADMVVLSVPLRAMPAIFRIIDAHIDPHAIITDVGSAKSTVEQAARENLLNNIQQYVPGHPIAGTEQSGVEASFAELYNDRRVILTPLQENSQETIERVKQMWEATGALVQLMPVDHHDEILAATSHLPHILAFGLVDTLSKMSDRDEIFQYAAGGFRDFSRIASSDPLMWRDICIENSEAIIQIMDSFLKDLEVLKQAIAAADLDTVEMIFTRAKQARDRYAERSAAPS
jgi:prephenate dehydrogenase